MIETESILQFSGFTDQNIIKPSVPQQVVKLSKSSLRVTTPHITLQQCVNN